MAKASIITIGDELLIGQVIDTNSAWIAQQLNAIGIGVVNRIAVGDEQAHILDALQQCMQKADVIIITGGLGPTADDVTKPALLSFFGGELVTHQPSLDFITDLFEHKFKKPLLEVNKKQAQVPSSCSVLLNKSGTAPGMHFYQQNTHVFSLPGVPSEMKWLMQHEVLPLLKQQFSLPHIIHQTLVTAGIGESFLADLISDVEKQLPSHIKLAYLPQWGIVRLRLSGEGTDEVTLTHEIQHFTNLLKPIIKPYLVAEEDITLQQVIAHHLTQQNKTLSIAESCTGGYLSHLFTAMAGASAYFKGGITAYSNQVKELAVHVSPQTLQNHGAVSEETVLEMATNIRQQFKTDYSIAVSGILGPSGGTAEKPVGTVWIALGLPEKTITKKYSLPFDRQRNMQQLAVHVLNELRIHIM